MQSEKMTKRLRAVFSIIPDAESIADIGTDHGYLAAALITGGKAQRVIAGDIHKGPLESARQYIASCGLTDRIDCRLGNGLQVTLRGEIQGAVCCGMGGFLMIDIIEAAPEALEFYVLQPQNGQKELRRYMVDRGYTIAREIVMRDMGKFYTAFLAVRNDCLKQYGADIKDNPYGQLRDDSLLWSVGALLERERPDGWTSYIDELIRQRQCALTGMSEALAHTDKYQEILKEVNYLKSIR